MHFLLYGANGYMGRLMIRYAASLGLRPVLAGRNAAEINSLAQKWNLPCRVFDLNETAKLEEALRLAPVVLHCAGPYRQTARPMMEACLRTGTHYLDLAGEIPVFQLASDFHPAAQAAGVMLMPGAGFDIVPSDCLALHLKNRLPDATHLQMAFANPGGGISRGTALSLINSIGEPGVFRIAGKIVPVPLGAKTLYFPPGTQQHFGMSLPWADVYTAWYTAGIPNVEVYSSVSPFLHRWIITNPWLNRFLSTIPAKAGARKLVYWFVSGPSERQRANAASYWWGKASNARGDSCQATLTLPDSYSTTVHVSLFLVNKVLHGLARAGFQTPAGCFGENLILEIQGVSRH